MSSPHLGKRLVYGNHWWLNLSVPRFTVQESLPPSLVSSPRLPCPPLTSAVSEVSRHGEVSCSCLVQDSLHPWFLLPVSFGGVRCDVGSSSFGLSWFVCKVCLLKGLQVVVQVVRGPHNRFYGTLPVVVLCRYCHSVTTLALESVAV